MTALPVGNGLPAGGPERWRLAERDLVEFRPGSGRVVIVSAHPDDETLAVGGLMQGWNAAGADLEIVIATDGEAAFPDASTDQRAALGRRRRDEMAAALDRLGLAHVRVHWLGLPDGGIGRVALATALRPLLAGVDVCVAPWGEDPHPDHAAAGRAARDAAPDAAQIWQYPIWAWVWESPEPPRLPWANAAAYRLDDSQAEAKQSAIDAFVSQLGPGPHGQPPVVDEYARAHFAGRREVLFRLPHGASTPVSRFAAVYGGEPDPWGTRKRSYERRKRAVTLASLPRPRYGHAVDAGCGSGALTAELATRCDSVLAFDPVPAAIAATTEATRGLDHVRIRTDSLPGGLTGGPFDLFVFSEVLYYLARSDLEATLALSEQAAAPGADLVAVDWRHLTADAPRDADDAHRQLLNRTGWKTLVHHAEDDFLLHVLRRSR